MSRRLSRKEVPGYLSEWWGPTPRRLEIGNEIVVVDTFVSGPKKPTVRRGGFSLDPFFRLHSDIVREMADRDMTQKPIRFYVESAAKPGCPSADFWGLMIICGQRLTELFVLECDALSPPPGIERTDTVMVKALRKAFWGDPELVRDLFKSQIERDEIGYSSRGGFEHLGRTWSLHTQEFEPWRCSHSVPDQILPFARAIQRNLPRVVFDEKQPHAHSAIFSLSRVAIVNGTGEIILSKATSLADLRGQSMFCIIGNDQMTRLTHNLAVNTALDAFAQYFGAMGSEKGYEIKLGPTRIPVYGLLSPSGFYDSRVALLKTLKQFTFTRVMVSELFNAQNMRFTGDIPVSPEYPVTIGDYTDGCLSDPSHPRSIEVTDYTLRELQRRLIEPEGSPSFSFTDLGWFVYSNWPFIDSPRRNRREGHVDDSTLGVVSYGELKEGQRVSC